MKRELPENKIRINPDFKREKEILDDINKADTINDIKKILRKIIKL
jgi:hypothetical protein